jgi:hypothetical protein
MGWINVLFLAGMLIYNVVHMGRDMAKKMKKSCVER